MIGRLTAMLRSEVFGPFVDALFDAVDRDCTAVTFVQVGSNDATEGDVLKAHIRKSGWHGVMIEPVPYIFDRLRRTWGDVPGLAFENVAISDTAGTFPFYAVERDEAASLPAWYDQIGSFDRGVVMKAADVIPDLARRIVEIAVPTMTFGQVVTKHGLARIDVLQIDTEGHDLKIVQSIDFADRRPGLIVFEHKHLSAADRATATALLRTEGYLVQVGGTDTVAFDATARSRYPATNAAFRRAYTFVLAALPRIAKRVAGRTRQKIFA